MKTDKELAAELDRLKGTGRELEGTEPVAATVTKNPRAVISLRMSSDELHAIEDASAGAGKNVSEFIRESALARAEAHAQALVSVYVARLLAEVRSIEESLEGIKDAVPEAFKLASQQRDHGASMAEGYRHQVTAKLEQLTEVKRSLDELWEQTA